MSLHNARSREQAAQILAIVSTLFEFTKHFNDARTRTARRLKCVAVGTEFVEEEYTKKEARLRELFQEANIPFLNIFFTPSKPHSTWPGVVLHIIVPNQDNV